MNIGESVILGIVQGLTEFLPVSSSGHLFIFESLVFGKKMNIPFDAFLHLATLVAVLLFFRMQIWSLLRNFFSPKGEKKEKIYAWKLLFATLMTAPIAFALKPYVENDLTKSMVGSMLLLTASLILLAEYASPPPEKRTKELSWKTAFFLGIVQSIAVMPGISRSGATIVFLMLSGVERKKAVEISFLLSIPTILGAFVFLIPELRASEMEVLPLILGGLSAFSCGLAAIWLLLKWVEKYWVAFAVWCAVVGGVVLLTPL